MLERGHTAGSIPSRNVLPDRGKSQQHKDNSSKTGNCHCRGAACEWSRTPHRRRRARGRSALHAPQVCYEIGCRLVSLFRRLRQALGYDSLEIVRDLAAVPRQGLWLRVQDLEENGRFVLPLEGPLTTDQLEEHHSQRKEIASWIHALPLGLLGRHVVRCPHPGSVLRESGRSLPSGQAEIGDLNLTLGCHENID